MASGQSSGLAVAVVAIVATDDTEIVLSRVQAVVDRGGSVSAIPLHRMVEKVPGKTFSMKVSDGTTVRLDGLKPGALTDDQKLHDSLARRSRTPQAAVTIPSSAVSVRDDTAGI